jgi:hypothetical protein
VGEAELLVTLPFVSGGLKGERTSHSELPLAPGELTQYNQQTRRASGVRRLIDFRLLAIACAIAVLACLGVTAPESAVGAAPLAQAHVPTGIIGDADCSGAVNTADILQLLWQIAGVAQAPCEANADVNCDSSVGIDDVIQLLRFAGGLGIPTVDGCLAIGDVSSAQPSQDVIQQALTNGDIDDQTALVYEVFAAFGDPRLPPQYQPTPGAIPTDSDIGIELSYKFAQLSPENQALVKPYMTPPGYPGSWIAPPASASIAQPASGPDLPPETFAAVPSQNGKVIVWWQTRYQEDEATAHFIADSVDDNTWSKLTTLMGREPISDAADEDNGGDGRLDIYLVDLGGNTLGVTMPYSSVLSANTLTPASTYILVDRQGTDQNRADVTVGHELFHTIQFSYTSVNSWTASRWMYEATAAWSQDYVFPDSNEEQPWADHYFHGTAYPLDQYVYEAYVFFFYLSHTYGVDIIPQLFTALETETPLAALNSTIPGGLDGAWSAFALDTVNTAPNDEFFQWDSLPYRILSYRTANQLGTVAVTADNQAFRPVFPNLQPMSIQSYKLDFSALSGSDLVTLIHPNPALPSGMHVWLETVVNGQPPQFTEWTDPQNKNFCLSDPQDSIESAWIVIANSNPDTTVPLNNDIMQVSPSCGWYGESSLTYTQNLSFGGIPVVETRTFAATNLQFDPTNNPGVYEVKSGTLTDTISGTFSDGHQLCSVHFVHTRDINQGDGQINIVSAGKLPVMYWAHGATEYDAVYTADCTDGPEVFTPNPGELYSWLETGFSGSFQTSSDFDVLDGTFTNFHSPFQDFTYRWHFTYGDIKTDSAPP